MREFKSGTVSFRINETFVWMREMKSDDYEKEKEILTHMEIKLRLLDLEGVDLPTEAPPIPPPPKDFNFAS